MNFKSTQYAKIMTDAKKYGLFDNIRFPQLRFHCKYYITRKNAYGSECPEIIGKNLFLYLKIFYFLSMPDEFPAIIFEPLPRLLNR